MRLNCKVQDSILSMKGKQEHITKERDTNRKKYD